MFTFSTTYPQPQNIQGQFLTPSCLNNQCPLAPSYLPQSYSSLPYLPYATATVTPVNANTASPVTPQTLFAHAPVPTHSHYMQPPVNFWQPPLTPPNYQTAVLPYLQQQLYSPGYQPQANVYTMSGQPHSLMAQPIQSLYGLPQPQLPVPTPMQIFELPLPFSSIRPGYLPTPAFTYQPLSSPGGVIH